MKKITIYLMTLLVATAVTVTAQTRTDSLEQGARRYVARNFSEVRTFNLYWETTPSQDYTLQQNGKEIENGKIRDVNTLKFSTTIPVVLLKNFSLYANGHFNSYQFETINNVNETGSAIFSKNEEGYKYYEGTVTGTYRTKIGSKPLILIATGSGDGWNKGIEKVQGIFSAVMIFKRSATTSFSAGLCGMTLYETLPVLPIINYWHQFNQNLSIDVILPSRAYLRYQYNNNQRLSIGASLESDHFYMESGLKDLPKVSFFNKISIKPELVYEYIINHHFYLSARGGAAELIKGGLYNTNRRGQNIKFTQPMTPYFNLGFSYNLF